MTTVKKLWIGIGIFALVSPLGLIIPALFNAGGAWGEWGTTALEKIAGFVPDGMKRVSEIWKAPLSDYAVPGQKPGLVGGSVGYVLTALIGVALTASTAYLLAKIFSQKNIKPKK